MCLLFSEGVGSVVAGLVGFTVSEAELPAVMELWEAGVGVIVSDKADCAEADCENVDDAAVAETEDKGVEVVVACAETSANKN